MQIPSDQIAYKRKVGRIGNDAVFEIGMKGGLHLIVAARRGKAETLGVGPHRAVARHIAMKREPELEITELSKGEHYEDWTFVHLLPRYQQVTDSMRKLQGL